MAGQPAVTLRRTLAVLLVGAALGGAGVVWKVSFPRDDLTPPPPASPTQAAPLPLSSLSLPVAVPLSGIREAVNARIPREFARVQQDQRVLGGRAGIHIRGAVVRAGDIRIVPSDSADTLELEVPLSARFSVRPELSGASWAGRLESTLTRDFGGEATVRLKVKPYIQPDWEAGAQVSGELRWTDPLAVELVPGTRLSVAALAESAVRAQLTRVTQEVARAVRESAALRSRAEQLWGQVGQPWPLPLEGSGVGPAYAQVMPQSLTVAGLGLRDDALHLTLQAEGYLRAELGQPPLARPASAPLPALQMSPQPAPGELHLRVPILLPFAELSSLATAAAQRELLALRLPGGTLAPRVQLDRLEVTGQPAQQRLTLTARLTLSGLGLRQSVTADISGRPWLRPGGRTVTLENVQVATRDEGLSSRLLGLLADARLEEYLARSARFDLGPRLDELEDSLAARLPYSPLPGLRLRGDVGELRLDDLRVTGQGLQVTAAADGALDVLVDAGQLPGRP